MTERCPVCGSGLAVAGNVSSTGVDGFDGADGRTLYYVCPSGACPVSVTDPAALPRTQASREET